MKKVLIMGANGFIGKNLAKALNKLHIQTYGYDYLKTPNSDIAKYYTKYFSGDFVKTENLQNALEDIDVVYQLIYIGSPSHSTQNVSLDIQNNVLPNIALLDIIKRMEKKPKLVFASSGGAVYGSLKDEVAGVDHETNPVSSYGVIKLTIEKYIQIYHRFYNIEYTIARIANPYGMHQNLTNGVGLITRCFKSILNNETLNIWGDGSYVRDYIHIDDLTSALVKIGDNDHVNQKILNIGSGKGYDINQIIEIIQKTIKETINCQYIKQRNHDVDKNILNIMETSKLLDWYPQFSIEEGIKHYWQSINRQEL